MDTSERDKEIQSLLNDTFQKVKNNNGGKLADYIPQLAKADPKLFGITFVSCDGKVNSYRGVSTIGNAIITPYYI